MRPPSFPEPRRDRLRGGIFASDLCRRCEHFFQVFAERRTSAEAGGVACDVVALPVTIPIDEEGFVLIGPATLDCAKRPATMEVVRPRDETLPYRFGIALLPLDGLPLVIPGVAQAGSSDEQPAASQELTFAIAGSGFAAVGYGPDGAAFDLTMTEHTAGELATALLIALGVKLAKAERGDPQPGLFNPGSHVTPN